MADLKLVASAAIGGAKTNRVRVKRKPDYAPQSALRRFRKDPSTRGLDCVIVSVSMPVRELAALDEAAEGAQMARSHFLREAARQFAERLKK